MPQDHPIGLYRKLASKTIGRSGPAVRSSGAARRAHGSLRAPRCLDHGPNHRGSAAAARRQSRVKGGGDRRGRRRRLCHRDLVKLPAFAVFLGNHWKVRKRPRVRLPRPGLLNRLVHSFGGLLSVDVREPPERQQFAPGGVTAGRLGPGAPRDLRKESGGGQKASLRQSRNPERR